MGKTFLLLFHSYPPFAHFFRFLSVDRWLLVGRWSFVQYNTFATIHIGTHTERCPIASLVHQSVPQSHDDVLDIHVGQSWALLLHPGRAIAWGTLRVPIVASRLLQRTKYTSASLGQIPKRDIAQLLHKCLRCQKCRGVLRDTQCTHCTDS